MSDILASTVGTAGYTELFITQYFTCYYEMNRDKLKSGNAWRSCVRSDLCEIAWKKILERDKLVMGTLLLFRIQNMGAAFPCFVVLAVQS
jgi:hypothetical protein